MTALPEETRDSDCRAGRLAVALSAMVLLAYGFVATRSTLFDRDEPRFAAATVEMVESGNYLYPTFNGELRPDKPIMVYWLMSVPVRLLGPTELAVRLPSVAATACSCLLLYLIGKRLFNRRVGLWASAAMVSTPLMLMVGTAATADGVLLLTITAAFVALAFWVSRSASPWQTVLLSVSLGAALLTKGPVGLAVPLLAALAITWFGRRDDVLAGARFWLGLLVAVVVGVRVFLAWAIPANIATKGQFAAEGLGHHVLTRMFQPLEGHGGDFFVTLPFYFVVVLVGFFPWTLHLPAGLSAALGGRLGGARGRAFLLGWILPIFVLMSLLATKLPHYILGIWPALGLVVAATLDAADKGTLNIRDRRCLAAGVWLFAPPGVAVGLLLLIVPWLFPISGLHLPCCIGGVILLVTTVLAALHHVAGRVRTGARVAFAGYSLFLLVVVAGVLPVFERYKPIPVIAAAIRQQTSDNVPVWASRFNEPSLQFYLRRPPIRFLHANEKLAAWAKEPAPGVLVIPRQHLDRVEAEHGKLPLEQLEAASGFNYPKGRKLELVALGRSLPDSQ